MTVKDYDLYFLRFLQILVIPIFRKRFMEIPKAIDMIPNCIGPLALARMAQMVIETLSVSLLPLFYLHVE